MFFKKGISGTQWINNLRHLVYKEVLKPHGFRKKGAGWWIRWNGWKADRVDITNRYGGIVFHVKYTVLLPPPPNKNGWLDANSIVQSCPRMLLGQQDKNVRIPQRLSKQTKLMNAELQNIRDTITWFDTELGTPEKCLTELETFGFSKDSQAYSEMKSYLELVMNNSHDKYMEELKIALETFELTSDSQACSNSHDKYMEELKKDSCKLTEKIFF